MREKKIFEDFLMKTDITGPDLILSTLTLNTRGGNGRSTVGVLMVHTMLMWAMTTGGVRFIHITITSNERMFQTTATGAEEAGETSTGGGIEKLDSSMTPSTSLPRETLDGGTVSRTTKTFLHNT